MITTNDGGLGPVTHSFPPSHQGGRGTIKGSNHHRVNNPPKEWTRPLSKNTDRTERSECPHAGVHPTCLTIQRSYPLTWKYTDPPEVKWTPTPSHQGVDGAVACRPRSTGWHVQVTKDSTNQPARECDVTMSFHGSSTKTSTDPVALSSVNELGTLTGPRSLLWTRYRGPHPPTHPPCNWTIRLRAFLMETATATNDHLLCA